MTESFVESDESVVESDEAGAGFDERIFRPDSTLVESADRKNGTNKTLVESNESLVRPNRRRIDAGKPGLADTFLLGRFRNERERSRIGREQFPTPL
ncbi:MAG: hypothetical protein V4710_03975 [Verrucomicrobiota bacterium]